MNPFQQTIVNSTTAVLTEDPTGLPCLNTNASESISRQSQTLPLDNNIQSVTRDSHLSEEVVQSIQSVKQVCLVALDSLLRNIIADGCITNSPETRLFSNTSLQAHRLLESPHYDLLGSIARHTTSMTYAVDRCTMETSDTVPELTTMINVKRLLNLYPIEIVNRHVDYNLCCTLAELLNNLYRILELAQEDLHKVIPHVESSSNIYQQLQVEVSEFQHNRDTGLVALTGDTCKEISELWKDIGRLISTVNRITCSSQSMEISPPPYTETETGTKSTYQESLPRYFSTEESLLPAPPSALSEKTQHDLDDLLTAIDRLSCVAPRLTNQTITLTESQANEIAMATVARAVETLSSGRMENQRAPLRQSHDFLMDLIIQMNESAARTFDNQRVPMGEALEKKIEMGKVSGVLSKMDRGRFTNQDWSSPNDGVSENTVTLNHLLAKSLDCPGTEKQKNSTPIKKRMSLSARPSKKIDLFIEDIKKKQRCTSASSSASPEESDKDLVHLFNHIFKSKPQLENQRASFSSSHSPTRDVFLTSLT
ncbi:hypothetical protein BDF14DRAFT_1795087 [Spinellus fusiger]|nr:hypothetical protein BDF14DRAFT_1795087 [Spinellus fusiger]